MTESEALNKMIPPGTRRPGKPNGGVVQVLVTSSCNLSCFHCTQGSNLRREPWFMTPDQFEAAVLSLKGYWGSIGVFGGCPTIHPQFETLCEILRKHWPKERCGLWANNLMGHGAACRLTFSEAISNLNVHLDHEAHAEMRRDWPESHPFGLTQDSRHSPPFVAMRDVEPDESKRWELIADCDINKHWSALIGVFRGELRAWFCEISGAQSILHQDDPNYPDTGLELYGRKWTKETDRWTDEPWWKFDMTTFRHQVRKHCHDCGIPLRGYGQLAQAADGVEQVSATHQAIYRPKRRGRAVELVTVMEQLQPGRLTNTTKYLQNSAL